ncbi:hypothetical protein MMC18_008523 [Xylographa bjoerkii]|nr:hypothetical protein [Xylographa bjoerkii]
MNVPTPAGTKKGSSREKPVDPPKLYHENGKKITHPESKAFKRGGNRIKGDGKRVKNKIGRPGWDQVPGAVPGADSKEGPGKPKQPKIEVKNEAKTIKDGRKVMTEDTKAKGQDGQSSHKYNVVTATFPDDPNNPDAGTRAHHPGVKYDMNRVASWDGTDSAMLPQGQQPSQNKKNMKAFDPEGSSLKKKEGFEDGPYLANRVTRLWGWS